MGIRRIAWIALVVASTVGAIAWLWHGVDYVRSIGKEKSEPFVFMLSDFLKARELPYDTPAQVIYRIDDHRFVTLETYRDCHYGEAYYNDTKLGLHRTLGRTGVENYQGWIINDDPTGRNLAFPMGAPPDIACPERGCRGFLLYSTDFGRSFSAIPYTSYTRSPYERSKDYGVFVTQEKLYVAKRIDAGEAYVDEYPLVPNIDLSVPYPPGAKGDSFALSQRPGIFDKLTTPSGQNQISCDASIKPTNPDARLVVPQRNSGY